MSLGKIERLLPVQKNSDCTGPVLLLRKHQPTTFSSSNCSLGAGGPWGGGALGAGEA